jgi:type IV pilus assembly protein PilM
MLPLGVDIGSTRLRVAVLSANEREPQVHNVVARELPHGTSSSGLVPEPEIVAEVLRDALAAAGVKERRCVAALREPDAMLRRVALPKMSAFERVRAARFEARRFVGDPIEECSVRLVPCEEGADFVLGIARTQALASRVKTLRRAGLHPVAIDHEAFAWRRAQPDVDCLIDVGLAQSTVVAFATPLPEVRTLERGGAAMTATIARSLGINLETAERRKRSIGEAGAAEGEIADLVSAIADAMVELRSAGHSVRRIALAGNGARAGRLAEALEHATGLDAKMAAFPASLRSAYPADVMRAAAPDWLFAYGIALWSLA